MCLISVGFEAIWCVNAHMQSVNALMHMCTSVNAPMHSVNALPECTYVLSIRGGFINWLICGGSKIFGPLGQE